MQITDLRPDAAKQIQEAAELLVEGFRPEAWPDIESALEEVRECLSPDRIVRLAIDADGAVLGWVGGTPHYGGRAWELHPLVVRLDHQGQGIGSALVADLEARVGERGGVTLFLGTDDEHNLTTVSGVDLYPNVFEHLARIRNLNRHPYEFYQKQGFVIVGIIPDANGLGKPDILMAKRVTPAR